MFLRKFQFTRRSPDCQLCVAFIDLSNAFGLIPHKAISRVLSKTNVGDATLKIVTELLSELCTLIVFSAKSLALFQSDGVRQEDPISDFLLNIAFHPIIRALNDLDDITVLVYADDILILSDNPVALQSALDLLLVECSKLNLLINIDKCSTLHLGGSPRECLPATFTLN